MRKIVAIFLGLLVGSELAEGVVRDKKPPFPRKALPIKEVVCKNALPCQIDLNRVFRDSKALEKQNFVIDFWNLERVEHAEDMKLLIEAERLVPVPSSTATSYIDPRLNKRTWFARPFTRDFIGQFTKDFYTDTQAGKVRLIVHTKTGQLRKISSGKTKRIKTTGLVRDRQHQAMLVRRLPRGQAASDQNGRSCQSSHLAGTTFDFSTKDFTLAEMCWVLEYLYHWQSVDRISVIWEPRNNAIHVMVFPFPTSTEHLSN